MLKVDTGKGFEEQYQILIKRDSKIKKTVLTKVEIFKRNPQDTRLENHPLRKRMSGKHAFSITDDIRIVYKWTSKSSVRFLAIGTHVEVYLN